MALVIKCGTNEAPDGVSYALVPEPGKKVKLTSTGAVTPSAVGKVRFYVQTAPTGSKLKTLDDYADLEAYRAGTTTVYLGTLPIATQREELRLDPTEDGGAEFTPDLPGYYVLRAYDVREYRFIPSFGGDVPGAGELAELDNETAALPAYAGGFAQAPTATLNVSVAQTMRRKFGRAPDTVEVAILTHQDRADANKLRHTVTVTPANTTAARLAAASSAFRRAVYFLEQETANFPDQAVIPWDTSAVSIGWTLTNMITVWNYHANGAGGTTAWDVHGAADATNAVTSPTATTLATAIARLNELRTDYAAHRVLTAGSVHAAADNANVVTASAATDLGSALTLWRDLRRMFVKHAGRNAAHQSTPANNPADGNVGAWEEPPTTLTELISQTNSLVAAYEAHRVRTTGSASALHTVADTDHVMSTTGLDLSNHETLFQAINTFATYIEQHAADVDTAGAVAGYHGTATTLKIQTRAGSPATAQACLEEIMMAMERHFSLASVHGGAKGLGLHAAVDWPYFARFTKAISDALTASVTTPPTGFNEAGSALVGYGWA